jgi:homoserine kinase
MTPTRIKVYSPATIANVGPGFDVLGVAIEQPGDVVIAEIKSERGVAFHLHDNNIQLPTDKRNVAAHVAELMLDESNSPFGVKLTLQKNMPLCSGLGSSAASAAAAVVAVNELLARPFTKMDLIRFAVEGERLASGTAHADNVAPAILGGICLVRSYEPLDIIQLPYKNIFYWVVVHPHLSIETKTARSLLPTSISLPIAIQQNGNLAALITGLNNGDAELISASLHDVIAEPVRAKLIPSYDKIKYAAMYAGAIGFSISGSGPSVFAMTLSESDAKKVADNIVAAFAEYAGVECETYISLINERGTIVLESTP